MSGSVSLRLNGVPTDVGDAGENETLLTTLRDRLGMSSVRYCCGIGVCGTCTVLVEGHAVSSCLLLTSMCDGRDVQTAERLATDADPLEDRVLQAFSELQAFQCSYCIPAFVVTIVSVLRAEPDAPVERLREQLSGNLCRCGSYPQIQRALERIVEGRTTGVEDQG
ncbi:MAG: 2Fe-2S iron-sulfur cluster binding domain-containing protein [Actinophytocola sp.]|uniref:(2Fe-2S)-binding protein n=1 Tax=Actinophytocola sp. TaxID=1872138 RepID=UPI00132BF268|nr:2Fe-2S iron-sulfur cluster-binding protein [Actinophytocola sp.]MPZ86404.1 2Fe-2S iron-sulfur cluster binding domain-containing protein [Actinophytocola sp.]